MFEPYLSRWRLEPDGEPILSRSGRLLPVRKEGVPAMLKIATEAEERWDGLLMVWWDGEGAARVLAHDGEALLLERARDAGALAEMARSGGDEAADRIICRVAARLHAPRGRPMPELIPLETWFAPLAPVARRHGGILARAAATARGLLARQREVTVLHGDLHHGNVLDFGPRGWLAIDPKRLVGDRAFDFANLLRNPDPDTKVVPARFARRVVVIADAAGIERQRLLGWTLAFAGLSAAWLIDDGDSPELEVDLAVARLATAALEEG